MKKLLLISFVFFISNKSISQFGHCVHGQGIQYYLDAVSASLSGCNCLYTTGFLFSMPSCDTDDYNLVFEDNFDGNILDLEKWEIQPWGQGALQGGASQEYYTLDNAIVSNGSLKIIAKQETVQRRAVNWINDNVILDDGISNLRTFNYTSSNIWTKEKYFFGKYEIRARLPEGNGLWPAFWMYGGQQWNEIDVFDNYSGINTLVTATGFDYDEDGTAEGCTDSFDGFDFSQWHTFTCIFDFDRITWLVDGNPIRTQYRFTSLTGDIITCGEDIAVGTYLINKSFPIQAMSIILNLAIGSGDGPCAAPDESTQFPSNFEIDYVRYYKRTPCDGCMPSIVFDNIENLPTTTRTQNYILTQNNTTVLSGQNVVLKSPLIKLLPGTKIENGAIFRAIPQECNYLNYDDEAQVNFIGSNAIDNYQIVKCIDPNYYINATGVTEYSFSIYNLLGQLVHSTSGIPTSNQIFVWNTANVAEGWYTVHQELSNCTSEMTNIIDYNVLVLDCRTSLTSNDSINKQSIQNYSYNNNKKETSLLNEILLKSGLVVYPNPTSDIFTIAFIDGISMNNSFVSIRDNTGRLLISEIHATNTINLSNYSNGIYFLEVKNDLGIFREKIIKQ